MELNDLFNRLWSDYTNNNPSALKIHNLFTNKGELAVNDHIAFRTINDPRVNIDVLASAFTCYGYVPKGEYVFEDKHLFARHYELPGDDNAPRIFISELIREDFSPYINQVFHEAIERAVLKTGRNEDFIFSCNPFEPLSYKVYSNLLTESEYAAWLYVFGFRANHFTVSVNALKKYNTLEQVNQLLKENGHRLNASGGEIKGSAEAFLRQSSTLADAVNIWFKEGVYKIPCCYYEFAQRYPLPDGKLFNGFVARSADKIFESTDNIMVNKNP